jgi:hypothetical protein
MARLLFLLSILFLAGCASPIDMAHRSRLHHIGAAVLLGDTLHGQRKGLTVFGNGSYDEPAPDFRIQATGESVTLGELRQGGLHVDLVPMSELPPGTVLHQQILSDPYYWNPQSAVVRAAVREVCARRHLDGLAVVWLGVFSDSAYPMYGVGLFGDNMFGPGGVRPYALVNLTVFDSAGNLVPFGGGAGAMVPMGEDAESMDVTWQDSLSDYAPEERDELRQKVQGVLQNVITEEIDHSGLSRPAGAQ